MHRRGVADRAGVMGEVHESDRGAGVDPPEYLSPGWRAPDHPQPDADRTAPESLLRTRWCSGSAVVVGYLVIYASYLRWSLEAHPKWDGGPSPYTAWRVLCLALALAVIGFVAGRRHRALAAAEVAAIAIPACFVTTFAIEVVRDPSLRSPYLLLYTAAACVQAGFGFAVVGSIGFIASRTRSRGRRPE
jgi:hypothetical protein